MNTESRISKIISKIEILIACIAFVSMLLCCGMYIDIKMNGKTSTLPSLSENDRRQLSRSGAVDSIFFDNDFIEPIFIGIKDADLLICACPDNISRSNFEKTAYDSLISLFTGNANEIEFENEQQRDMFIEQLKDRNNYMLISYFGDIPSTAFLPCLSQKYEANNSMKLFNVNHLFVLPDEKGNLFGISVSADKHIFKINPSEEVLFNKILDETYDIVDGYSYFEFGNDDLINPLMTSTFMSNKYKVDSLSVLYGKDKNSEWVNRIFDVFHINTSLMKQFSSKQNTQINYVDDLAEIVITDEGNVEFNATEGNGIHLYEYLSFMPDDKLNYTFSDMIFAVKRIMSKLDFAQGEITYSLVGADYSEGLGDCTVYLKSFVDGIVISDKAYDFMFKFSQNSLIRAELLALSCERLDDYSIVLPQKYLNFLIENDIQENVKDKWLSYLPCPVLRMEDAGENVYVVDWANVSFVSEVQE